MLLVDAAIIFLVVAHASSTVKYVGKLITSLSILGVLSYGIYGWHGYWLNTIPNLEKHALFLVFLSIATAGITYLSIERYALRLKK
jgi:hypothetical protein